LRPAAARLALAALAAATLGAAEPRPSAIGRVAWLAGCWHAQSKHRTVEESWMAPRGGSMIGVSRTVRGDSLFEYELVVVREKVGALAYHAHPSGQPAAVFPAREVTDSSVVFENAEHDFPQRIGYRRVSADSLVAWIEGTVGGQARRVDFPYRRAACPGR
jgi:hypothetical protein